MPYQRPKTDDELMHRTGRIALILGFLLIFSIGFGFFYNTQTTRDRDAKKRQVMVEVCSRDVDPANCVRYIHATDSCNDISAAADPKERRMCIESVLDRTKRPG